MHERRRLPTVAALKTKRRGETALLRAMADMQPTFTVEVDGRDRLVWANRHTCERNDFQLRDMIGRRIIDLWPDAPLERLADVRRSRQPSAFEERSTTRTGRRVIVHVTRTPLSAGHVWCVSIDLTDALRFNAARALMALGGIADLMAPPLGIVESAVAASLAAGATVCSLIEGGMIPADLRRIASELFV